ncbi:MAG TPA: DUF4004 domain-containing protein [Firmicutes bacterium]|nr:DUF4004 domain-containing protein [Bacillota bacterium]
MEIQLISKKELLQLTNISYGQLYRWKRKNLIPEEWFIKKSVTTGQETFFPKEQILERIEAILNLKDDVSLDELSQIFSPKVEVESRLNVEKLHQQTIVSDQSLLLFENIMKREANLQDIKEVFMVKVLQDYVISGAITLPEGEKLLGMIKDYFERINTENGIVLLLRYMGNSAVMASDERDSLFVDPMYIKVLEIEVMKEIGQIKLTQI